jgi:hypothetical protein
MYYLKAETTEHNVFMLCDGKTILSSNYSPNKSLIAPEDMKSTLTDIFLKTVNSDDAKTCAEKDTRDFWWITCTRQ